MNSAALVGTFVTGFMGLHVCWYIIQHKYVPPEERHEHPVVRLYQLIMKSEQ